MKIVLLPLDERPCNYNYPKHLSLNKEISLVLPPSELLSKKKKVCNLDVLHKWLVNECKDADYALLSLDTLIYGGIVPSRLHHDDLSSLIQRSETIRIIKENNPHIKIFVNELIMRTPCYSNSTEEPDYFDECGRELWEYGVLLDKKLRGIISEEEKVKMEQLFNCIPHQYLDDLMKRREINKSATINNVNYLLNGIIDYFIIPQDDCAPYGFTSIDRNKINEYLIEHHLENKVIMYPGADEAGLVLISKALNDYYHKIPKIYVKYVDDNAKDVIPDFEDRHLDKSISEHIYISGMQRIDSIDSANMVLVVNVYKEDHFADVMSLIKEEKIKGKIVGIADVLLCNHGDLVLFKNLDSSNLLKEIDAYAGWNTSSNTIGTTLSNMVSYYYSHDDTQKKYSLLARYLEDVFYMGLIRNELNGVIKTKKGNVSIENISPIEEELSHFAEERLSSYINNFEFKSLYDYDHLTITFPWHRTFEINLSIYKK